MKSAVIPFPQDELEYWKRKYQDLDGKDKRRKISQRKKEDERERQVMAEHRAADDRKAKSRVDHNLFNSYVDLTPYGPKSKDYSVKSPSTQLKNSTKGGRPQTKTETKIQAKRVRDESSLPESAKYSTYSRGSPTRGAGCMGSPNKLQKQGHHIDDKALFSLVPSRKPCDPEHKKHNYAAQPGPTRDYPPSPSPLQVTPPFPNKIRVPFTSKILEAFP